MQIPGLDVFLREQFAEVRDELVPAVMDAVANPLVTNGPAVRVFEQAAREYCRCRFALGVSSGTDALLLALMALDIGRGDEVITTPFTFFATAGSIWRVGARPVFVDIEPRTFNIDARRIEQAITPRTKAIMPVHLYGQLADMNAIMAVAAKHKLPVIEDAAQAIGADQGDKRAGSIGTIGALSFYPTKNLGALGDAGLVTTNDSALAEKMEKLRVHGQTGAYVHKWVGGNFRMDSIQGAALTVKLRHLEKWTGKRRANAARYNELLAGCEGVVTPTELPGNRHIYHQYTIRARRRDALQAFLKQQGIGTGVYYPIGLHLQECFAALGHKKGDFPQTEIASEEVLALPVFPEMTAEQIAYVAGKIREFMAKAT
ncbi:MAG: DegT/DnrJ/EryC1/StrS family aminotransferase [Phycisphaerae bacterium]